MGFRIDDPSFYPELKRSVVETFSKLGYIRLPVNPSELFETFGIQCIAFQSAYDSSTIDGLSGLLLCPSGLSFTISNNGNDCQYVACNLQESSGRVRFTKLHEMGHTVRNHLQDSETAEIEANFWAKYAIAPPVLVEELGVTTQEEVVKYFGTSMECASNILKYHDNWRRYRKNDRLIDDEILNLYRRGLLLNRKDKKVNEELLPL